MASTPRLVLSCEHAGARVPREFAELFASEAAQRALASHRGFDAGALAVARTLARRFEVALLYTTVTRLLVDANRSTHHRALHSEFSRDADPARRAAMLERHHRPHRERVRTAVTHAALDFVVHIAVHSFAASLGGGERTCDVGLLYDPSRPAERRLCREWQRCLAGRELRVRLNYPYRGRTDGLTTALRRELGPERYAGIELELNQKLVARPGPARRRVARAVGDALERTLTELR